MARTSTLTVLAALAVLLLILVACTSDDSGTANNDDPGAPAAEEASGTVDEVTDGESATTPEPEPSETATAADRSDRPPFWTRWWTNTDLDTRSVPLDEITSGGVPRDAIPPVDQPTFISPGEADEWLEGQEPVISFELGGEARAYPLQIMTWHEIVNDEVAGTPVTITFCPLCNSAVAFERDLGDHGVMRFGVSGLLRFSDLVMWDDRTESLWQQITGEAIVGELTGERLTMLPSMIVSYDDFKRVHPDGLVMSRDTGFDRSYGNNPYAGYDDIDSSPFLFQGESDGRMAAMERVLVLMINDEPMAYPYAELENHLVVHDELGGDPVVVFWQPGTTSALDQSSIAQSRDVGAAGAFSPVLDGEELRFVAVDGEIRDEQTGSSWSVLGRAVDGPLEGQQLDEYVHGTHFWFAWAAFQPETGVWSP